MITDFMADSVAEARASLSGWLTPEDRFTGQGKPVEWRELSDDPMARPAASRTNYPPKRESPTFEQRNCVECGRLYDPTGAAQRTCTRPCLLSLRRAQNHERRERKAAAMLSKADRKALRDACQHPEWYRYGAGRRMCKVCGRVAPELQEAA